MRKGFTLVELLAVIVILGIILSIASITITEYSNARKNDDYENIANIIEKNADIFVNTNDEVFNAVNSKLTNINSECKIDYSSLINANLIDGDTINPKTGNKIDKESYVKITLNEDYDFKYTFIDKDEDKTNQIKSCLESN
ncbi:MAG: type II secretion system protein [Bacilli bacterium]|nr:type II secretion system protein [Bacilli bacterium]